MSKSREDRKRIMLRAQMRVRGAVSDVQIFDVSSRGLSLGAASAPPRGEIVEIIVGRRTMAGQVRWARGNRFGVVLHERINVDALRQGELVPLGTQRAARSSKPEQRLATHDKIFLAACVVAGIAFLIHAYNNWI